MYAERLKKLRNRLGLKADEMAASLELKPRTYGSYERGENMLPVEVCTRICYIFNVNGNWLLTGEGEVFNAPKYEQVEADLTQRMEKMEAALRSAGILAD